MCVNSWEVSPPALWTQPAMEAVKGTKGKPGKGRYGKFPKKTTTPQGGAPPGGAEGGLLQGGATRRGAVKQETSDRGEHVINNNVLKVSKNIIDAYRNFCDTRDIHKENTPNTHLAYICEAGYCPQADMRSAIGEIMKVVVDESYIDVNATIYGWSIEKLNKAVVCYMKHLCDDPNGVEPRLRMYDEVGRCVKNIKDKTLYVDPVAKQLWLEDGGQERMFNEAKDAVSKMFQYLADKNDVVNRFVWELKT